MAHQRSGHLHRRQSAHRLVCGARPSDGARRADRQVALRPRAGSARRATRARSIRRRSAPRCRCCTSTVPCSAPPASSRRRPDVAKRWTWEQVVEAGRKIAKPAENLWGFTFEQQERPYQLLPLGQSLGGVALFAGRLQGERLHRRPGLCRGLRLHAEALHRGEDLAAGPVRHGADARAVRLRQVRDAARRHVHLRHVQDKFPNLDFAVAPHPYFARASR